MSMLLICLYISLICAGSLTCFALVQHCLFSKILLINTATSLASVFICLLGSIKVNSSYLDIALIYFLLSVIASAAYSKYFMQTAGRDHE
jgi:multisubunit Na+/H+ antiporter MnhF subunit